MQRQGENTDQLEQVVAAADVDLLVEEDQVPLPLGQGRGQVDFGTNGPQDKGGGDVIGQIEVVPEPDGPHQPPSEPHQGDQIIQGHGPHAGQPNWPCNHGEVVSFCGVVGGSGSGQYGAGLWRYRL